MTERNYTIDFNDPVGAARGMINIFIEQLESFRWQTDKPDELEWEIRVYRYMLEDPFDRLTAYREMRRSRGLPLLSKREAVERLGWAIP